MIDTSFEKILFENAPKDAVQQAADNVEAANKASAQAHKDANEAQAKSDTANNLAAKVLGLQQGETLKPADVLAKLKADPTILDKIAGDENLLGMLKTSKENILALKNAPMLNSQEETQPDKSEPAQTNQGEAAPTTEQSAQPTQQPEQNATNNQQGDANNIANNTKAKPTVDAINRGLSSGLSVDDLIAYLQTLKK